MKVTPSRFAYWIAHRFSCKTLDAAMGMAPGEFRFNRYADIYEQDSARVRNYFAFSSEDFEERFATALQADRPMLGCFERSHLMRPLGAENAGLWVPTQEMVIRSARLYQIGPITRFKVQELMQSSPIAPILKTIQRQPGVLRIVLGGSWLGGNTSACLAVAVVTDGLTPHGPGKLHRLVHELQWQLEYFLGSKHVLPILLLHAQTRFPSLFSQAVTVSPIPNWNPVNEELDHRCDQRWADELYSEWNRLLPNDPGKREHRLIVQAFALRHFA